VPDLVKQILFGRWDDPLTTTEADEAGAPKSFWRNGDRMLFAVRQEKDRREGRAGSKVDLGDVQAGA